MNEIIVSPMKKTSNELKVKYSNKMNEINVKKLKPNELDIFMYACAKAKNQQSQVISIPRTEFVKKLDPKGSYLRTAAKIDKAVGDVFNKVTTTMSAKIGSKNKHFVLFNEFEYDEETNTINIEINKNFLFILNDFSEKNPFTEFEFKKFLSLNSTYSKNLYRHLMQWRSVGECYYSIEDFSEFMDIPKTYRSKDIVEKVIKPSTKELIESKALATCKYEVVRSYTQGRPIKGFKFRFAECINDNIPGQIELDDLYDKELITYKDENNQLQHRTVDKKKKKNDYIHRDYGDMAALEKELFERGSISWPRE